MKGNDDFVFEERKVKDRQQVIEHPEQEQEYYKGGGGGPSGFFSIKTNVYSKQCYSDPNNPGKIICKETKNTSGFDPLNKDKNYQNSKENVYTLDDKNGFFGGRKQITTDVNNEEPSFFQKISNKLKGLFSEDEPASDYNPEDDPYVQYERYKNARRSEPHQHGGREDFNDPFIDQFDRMFRNMQQSFIKHAFFDNEDFEQEQGNNYNEMNDPFAIFFQSAGFPHSHNIRQHPFEDSGRDEFFTRGGQRRSKTPSDESHYFGSRSHDHYDHEKTEYKEEKPIKYSDSKIYDV